MSEEHGVKNAWVRDWEAWDTSEDNRRSTAQILDKLRAPPAAHWWKGGADRDVSVLDFGCGTGRLLRALLDEDMVSAAVGVDVEEGMSSVFRHRIAATVPDEKRARIEAVLLHKHDGSELPGIARQPFDVAVTCYALGHIREAHIGAAVDNLARVIKPSGHLFVAEIDRIEDQMRGGARGGRAHEHSGHNSHEHGCPEHANAAAHISDGGHQHTSFTQKTLTAMLENAGLGIDRVDRYSMDIEGEALNALAIYATRR